MNTTRVCKYDLFTTLEGTEQRPENGTVSEVKTTNNETWMNLQGLARFPAFVVALSLTLA